MTTNAPALAPVTLLRFFRLIGGVIAATVGIVFLVIGINLLTSQQWPTVTGTVKSCTVTTSTSGSHTVDRQCTITWQEAGVNHSKAVDFGSKNAYNGQMVQIRVNGDEAVLPSPAWVAVLMFAIGIALIGLCVFLWVRSRRRARTVVVVQDR